ncbi:alpha/beta hydrolase fold domain-containing protein [Brachybacterium sp. GCM10030267]|uniref:alpha/beta hydrolase fold domain-containing protein n=1 Tax=unclassified Brachybacterium TaxID=2623841 RepID=UPI00361A0DD0
MNTTSTQVINRNGAWCWFQDERALVDAEKGVLVVGSVASGGGEHGHRRKGDVDLTVVDLASGRADVVTLHPGLEADDHNAPALFHRPDGRWLAVYTRHKSDPFTRWRVSAPGDPTTWGEERTFDWSEHTAGGGVTYSNLREVDGRLYCFARAVNDDPCALVSTDHGESWQYAGRLVGRPKIGYVNGYARYADGQRGLHLLVTDHHPRDHDNSIYHGYLSGGRLHDSRGRALESPLLSEPAPDQALLTTVLEAGTELGGARLGHAWTTDLREADGTLAAVMTARADHVAAPDGSDLGRNVEVPDLRFVYARLGADGTWGTSPLAKAGPGLLPHEQDYTGLAAIDPYDVDTVVISTPIDPRDDARLARRELFEGRTEDEGRSWRWTPLTQDSEVDNLRPIIAPGDPETTRLLWFRGDMRSSQDYDCEIALRSTPRRRARSEESAPAAETATSEAATSEAATAETATAETAMVARLSTLRGHATWDEAGQDAQRAWEAPYGPAEQWPLTVEDRLLPGPHGRVPVRLYTPQAPATGPRPCLVWLHGGAFVHGDLDMPEGDHVARGVAGRADAVVVSVDYRLCDQPDGTPARGFPDGPGHVHAPIPLDDACAAMAWVRKNAESLGIDPARIAIGGASAGGALAAAGSLRLAEEGAPPAASLLMYPVAHPLMPEATPEEAEALAATPEMLRFPPERMREMSENYLGGPLPEASPYEFPGLASREQLAVLPRTYLEADEFDDLRLSARRYAEQLREAGVDVEYVVCRGVSHGHLNKVGLPQAFASMDTMAKLLGEL